MASQIKKVSGQAFPLSGNAIDTDRIIPARYLRCVTFNGLEDHVFEDDRKQLKGAHPFDDLENQGRTILIVDESFGCGSSREHAVAAIKQWGIEAIIGLSFADIFRGNARGNGLVCVEVSPDVHQKLLTHVCSKKEDAITIDLDAMEVAMGSGLEILYPCSMPAAHRDMLLNGTWDTTATLLEAGDAIEETAGKLPYVKVA